MFDLFRSRDKAVRLMLGGLLVVVAISMLTYLVPNYDTNGPTANLVLATVGGEDIHADEVQRMVQTAMRGKQLPPDMLPIYIPQMVDDMIINRAMAYEAVRLGFEATQRSVAHYHHADGAGSLSGRPLRRQRPVRRHAGPAGHHHRSV